MRKIFFGVVLLYITLLPICSAAHYIVGFAEDAKDGTIADGHTIVLWNSVYGINDNTSDVIGPLGNSNINNLYLIDCESLIGGCNIGDILTLKVVNNGDNYISEEKNVTVGEFGYDLVDNITLNSPPTTNLISPADLAIISDLQVNFNCSYSDLDNNLEEISLYGNWTGEWGLNETKATNSSSGFATFTKILPEGFYKYSCKATDNFSISSFSPQNNSFKVDLKPIIDSVYGNISSSCGSLNTIRISCITHDQFSSIDKVIIETTNPSEIKNYSASLLSGNIYYADIQLNETGPWNFNCIANDSSGNTNNLTSNNVSVYSSSPELFVNFSNINLSEMDPIENQSININAVIENLGCENAENILIGFFEGDPSSSGKNIGNATININQFSSTEASIPWNAQMGPNNIFVYADYNYSITEENESNNKANRTISVNAWQEIYGNTTVDKIIGDQTANIRQWVNEDNLQGDVFITDSEASINWLSLQAIGKAKNGMDSSNDFLEIDEILNMTNFEDSVSNVFSINQNPKETQSMLIHQKEIQDVPVINSTNNSSFVTGIVWDTSKDTNGEFDTIDKEDIVFVTPINKKSEGAYGSYDYEIKIPSKLREYYKLDTQEIYLYYDLN